MCRPRPHSLTLALHADGQAALEAAVLTVVARELVDDARAVFLARVHESLLHCALEETCGDRTACFEPRASDARVW